MVTTIVPPYDGPIPPFDPNDLRVQVRGWLVCAQGDEDKAADPDDASYYQGWREACEAVLEWLLGERTPGTTPY